MSKASKVSAEPKRTFHKQVLNSKFKDFIYVKNGYHLVPCTGEAHGNAFIDNCSGCLGVTWGWMLAEDKPESNDYVTQDTCDGCKEHKEGTMFHDHGSPVLFLCPPCVKGGQ